MISPLSHVPYVIKTIVYTSSNMTTQGTQGHPIMRSMSSVTIVNIAGSRQERVPERDIAGIITRSYDMVYFQSKAVYKAGDTFIIVTHINKARDRLTYRYIHGHVRHSAPIYWSRVRNIEHPVQYINVRGSRIWAL